MLDMMYIYIYEIFYLACKLIRLLAAREVSCGFGAFQRDCERLLRGGWRVGHAEGHVLFPGSDHVETLCVFERGAS